MLAIAHNEFMLEHIRQGMTEAGLTAKELAEEAQTSYTTLTMILNGKRPLTPRMAKRLDAALMRRRQKGLVFTLPAATERKLCELARKKGITPSEAAEMLLERLLNISD